MLIIYHAHRWHGKRDPYLYTVKADLMEDGKILDTVETRIGCRTFEIDPERGFILNGEEYPLRGVSRHQDRWGIGNALLPEHHREDMELIMELGATTVRLAHYQHDAFFYDLCDEKGIVVWAEIPYISRHMDGGFDNTISQMKELIVQNYHHPSIIIWGLSNEITMNGDGEALLQTGDMVIPTDDNVLFNNADGSWSYYDVDDANQPGDSDNTPDDPTDDPTDEPVKELNFFEKLWLAIINFFKKLFGLA